MGNALYRFYLAYIKKYIPRGWFRYYHAARRTGYSTVAKMDFTESTNDLEKYFKENTGNLIHKWDHYFEVYDRHFSRFRGKPVTILEIGIYHGGSLEMWKHYFGPETNIYGVDINPECKKFEKPGTQIYIGSQSDREFLRRLKSEIPTVDILIDDGGHTMEQQIVTFEEMYDHVNENGVYLAEDLSTSYWPEYGGGYRKSGTFIEYAKSFIDSLNAWHSREDDLKPTTFTMSTHSLHFYDGMLVIEKWSHPKPTEHMTGTPTLST